MSILDKVDEVLVKEEDEVLHAYPDSLGYLTIGVGILIDQRKGGGITREESRYLLRNRTSALVAACRERFPWFQNLDPVRQQVIVCMAFQLGVDGVGAFKRMGAAICLGHYEEAAIEMLNSKWRRDTPGRCERMAEAMRTGAWS